MTHVLGLSFFYHDSAAALLREGVPVAAAEEERFSRRKHDSGFPEHAIDFCLRQAQLDTGELDYVVFYEKPLLKFERILRTGLATYPRSWRAFGEAMLTWFDEKLWIRNLIEEKTGVSADRILFTDHHISHAASAFFASPFDEAAIVTVDGVGEWTTTAVGRGVADWSGEGRNAISLIEEVRFPHSLGLLYSAFTAWLGFRVNNGEYKVMGMAPYGSPKYVDEVLRLVKLEDDGSFALDLDYFSFPHSWETTFNRRFVDLFGPPRVKDAPFVTSATAGDGDETSAVLERNQYYADVAASVQRVTEEVMLKIVRHAHRATGCRNLCLAGGVALNSVANGRIMREGPFEKVYIQPAAGDAGGALGAALYVWHALLGKRRSWVMNEAYLGQEFSDEEIRSFLDSRGIPYRHVEDGDALTTSVVDRLLGGRVVGLFQGRFEWGPRALGNRSILADPRRAEMKEIVNTKIKFREPFRPFAPVVLEEDADRVFEGIPSPSEAHPLRFMLSVFPWRDGHGERASACNHFGTGRLQTIRREWNPVYHDLVRAFGQATGVPVLLNTSFNLRGEPMVASPADAWRTFGESGIDCLVLGRHFIEK